MSIQKASGLAKPGHSSMLSSMASIPSSLSSTSRASPSWMIKGGRIWTADGSPDSGETTASPTSTSRTRWACLDRANLCSRCWVKVWCRGRISLAPWMKWGTRESVRSSLSRSPITTRFSKEIQSKRHGCLWSRSDNC